jgi:hypothetical protein
MMMKVLVDETSFANRSVTVKLALQSVSKWELSGLPKPEMQQHLLHLQARQRDQKTFP